MLRATASDIINVTAKQLAADPAMMLRAQVNRFASPLAGKYRLFQTALPLVGPVDGSVALRVGPILIARLIEQEGSGFDPKTDKLAGQIMGDTTGEVTRANLAIVTGIVSGYADTRGLPKPVTGIMSALTSSPVLYYAGALGFLLGAGVSFWKRRRA
jgi:hypothetical protein